MPYTSKDADYLADVEAAQKLASILQSRFQPTPRKGGMLGLCLSCIPLDHGEKVEILGRVYGLKAIDVYTSAVDLDYQDRSVRVIHPLQLYIAKGHNLADLDQTTRQDGKHLPSWSGLRGFSWPVWLTQRRGKLQDSF